VPLIACAGQGDLFGATGNVADVVLACNFYPNDDSPDIEAEVRRYADLLADRGLPLLITETNRRLDVDLPASEAGYLLRPEGVQVRVTAWSSAECIGRVWTGERPAFGGGDPDVLWIPPGWAGLTLLVTGMAGPVEPELRRLRLDSAT
jgi:hypothetical protein